MSRARPLMSCLALALLAAPAGAGKLNDARRHVRSGGHDRGSDRPCEDASKHQRRAPNRRHRRSCDSGWDVLFLFSESPAPRAAVDPLRIDYTNEPAPAPRIWHGKIDLEIGDGSGEISRTGFGFALEGESRWGVDVDWDAYSERLANGGHDELNVGQLNVTYRFFQSEYGSVRAGAGVGWFGDHLGTETGANFTVQTDVLLTDRLIAGVDLDIGTLGGAQTQHVSATLARRFGRFEAFAGYDFRRIGSTELKGPMVGLRLRW